MCAWEWKWSKDPKPEQLSKLLPDVRTRTLQTLKERAPHVARYIVDRIRGRGVIARDGSPVPIPEYSAGYLRLLEKLGLSTRPDMTLSGALLDHLSGRVRVVNAETLELRIAPYGRASAQSGAMLDKAEQKATQKAGEKEHPGQWYRPAYTYYDRRRKCSVTVPAGWIKTPHNAKEAKKKYRRKNILYNAHLATYLSMRLGGGKWASGGKPPSSFLTLTAEELASIHDTIMAESRSVAAEILRKVAGR